MYTAYLTHNNAYDAVVIIDNDTDDIVCAAQVDTQIFLDFHAENPDFGEWEFSEPYRLDCLDDPDDYGTVYAERHENHLVAIIDHDLYNMRNEFFCD